MNEQGFSIVGYGCTTCIGNSGDLDESVASAISENGKSLYHMLILYSVFWIHWIYDLSLGLLVRYFITLFTCLKLHYKIYFFLKKTSIINNPTQYLVVYADIVAAAVLSGNRNFEGRVHALTRANYLASPPLVVAYALAGTVRFLMYVMFHILYKRRWMW